MTLLWLPVEGSIEQAKHVIPGYDCRNPVNCKHTPKGDHGIHGDTHVYLYRDLSVGFVVNLDVSCMETEALPSFNTPNTSIMRGGTPYFPNGSSVHSHAAEPTADEDIRNGHSGDDCDYLGAPCFRSRDGYLIASELMDGALIQLTQEERAMVWKTGRPSPALDAALFKLLRVRFDAWVLEYKKELAEAPHRCNLCDGKGLLPAQDGTYE